MNTLAPSPWFGGTMREAQARVTDSLTNGPSDQSLELLTTAIRRIDARTARIVMSPDVVRALRAAPDTTLGAETFRERYTRRLLAAQRTRYAWIEHQRGRRPLT